MQKKILVIMLCCEKFWFCTMNKKTIMFCNCFVHKRERERKKVKSFSSSQNCFQQCARKWKHLSKTRELFTLQAKSKYRVCCTRENTKTLHWRGFKYLCGITAPSPYSYLIFFFSMDTICFQRKYFFIQTTKTKKT